MRVKGSIVAAAFGVALFAGQTQAAVLYDNGPINGTVDAWTINYGYAVSDSFTLSQASDVTGVNFGVWSDPGDTMTTVDWAITTTPATYTDTATATVTSGPVVGQGFGYYDLRTDSFSLPNISLGAGTYYLVLQNAVTAGGNPIYWDENDGLSTATESVTGSIGSESFQIIGNVAVVGATPLPSTWTMLIAGFLGLGFFAYRGSKKKNGAAIADA